MAKDLETKLKISADTKGAQKALGGVNKKLGATTGAAKKTGSSTEKLAAKFNKLGASALNLNQLGIVTGNLQAQALAALNLGDQYRQLEGRIDNTTDSQAETSRVMEELTRISLESHKPLQSTAELYARLAVNTEEAGYSQDQLLGFTEAINSALAVNNTSATEASGALLQLSQAMASGVLRGEEFNSVNEQMPAVIGAIGKYLGKTRAELRGMAEEGKLTSDVVMQATLSMGDAWKQQAADLPRTMGKAITDLETSWQAYLGTADGVGAASEALASTLGLLADNIDGVAGLAGDAALVALPALMLKAAQAAAAWGAQMQQGAVATREQALALEQEALVMTRRTDLLAIGAKAALADAAATEAEARATLAKVEAMTLEQPGIVKTAAYTRQLTAARTAHTAALKGYSVAQQQVAATSAEMAAAERAAATATGKFGASLKGLVSPLNALQLGFAGLIGYDIGTWLSDQSETVRSVGTAITGFFVHEFEVLRTGWEVLSALLTDDTVTEAIGRHLQRVQDIEKNLEGTYAQAKKGWNETGVAATAAGDAAAAAGIKAAEGWQGAIAALGSAKSAASGLKTVFDGLAGPDSVSGKGLDELLLAMAALGEQSNITGEAIDTGLRKALADLNGKELLEMQQNAQQVIADMQAMGDQATDAMRKQADAALAVLTGTLGAAMDQLGAKVTEGSDRVVDALAVVLDNAIATGDQIGASVGAALASENMDLSGIEAIKASLKQAQEQGRITFGEMGRFIAQADAAARQLAGVVTGPLLDAYQRMGIAITETKTASAAAAQQAKLDFDLIIQSADASGEARVKAAEAYLAAEKKAHDGVLPMTLDVTRAQEILAKALRDAGAAGKQAGNDIGDGMGRATDKTNEAADAAQRLADEQRKAYEDNRVIGAPGSSYRGRVEAQGDAQALAEFDRRVEALSVRAGYSYKRQLDAYNAIADDVVADSERRAAAAAATQAAPATTSTAASTAAPTVAPSGRSVTIRFGSGQSILADGDTDAFLAAMERSAATSNQL